MVGVSFGQRSRKGLTGPSPHHPEHHERITTGFLYREGETRLPEWMMLKHKVFREAQGLGSEGNRKARGKTLRTGSPTISDLHSPPSAKTGGAITPVEGCFPCYPCGQWLRESPHPVRVEAERDGIRGLTQKETWSGGEEAEFRRRLAG